MLPVPLSDKTRTLGAPSNWDASVQGECLSLDIADRVENGTPWMYSAWRYEPGEKDRAEAGAPMFLKIAAGRSPDPRILPPHPVVAVYFGEVAPPKSAAALAADIGRAVALSVQARLEVSAAAHPDRRILVSPPRVSAGAVGVEFVLVSPLEVIPPEFGDWASFGPFIPATGTGV